VDAITELRTTGQATTKLVCHSDLMSTDCPGPDLRAWVHNGNNGVTPAPPSTGLPTVALGSRSLEVGITAGTDVKFVQQTIGVPADGQFGTQTQGGVMCWQHLHSLSNDGQVGPQTWASLGHPMSWGAENPGGALAQGEARPTGRAMVAAQGGDPDARLPVRGRVHEVRAERSGFVTCLDAFGVGIAAWRLGAGRARKEDPVSAGAGVVLHAKPGDHVRAGEPLLTLCADDPSRFARALEALEGGIEVDGPAEGLPLLLDRGEA